MSKDNLRTDAFRCTHCCGQICKIITDDLPGHVHSYIWQCRGCWREFGPEWTETHGQDGELATILIGAEPWTPQDAVLETTLNFLTPHYPNWREFITQAIPAILIASISMIIVLDQLLQRSTRAIQTTLI